MYQSTDLPVTSINALISTIKTDKQVRWWFVCLLLQRALKEELSQNKEAGALYKKFRSILCLEKVIFFLLLIVFLLVIVTRQFQYSFLPVIFFVISVFLQVRKRQYIVKVCTFLLKRDFDRSLFARKTLYQIGEFYGRKYNVVSLVNTVTSVDNMTRKAVFYTIIFATFIYPLSFWQIGFSVLAAYYIFYGIASAIFVYKRAK
ncbi:MAG: hypothetical protein KAS66_09530 [Candidatus Omnitrophica bacterium]|nr:hypothetical protein [Candidatus Omnitrophota bacterium]